MQAASGRVLAAFVVLCIVWGSTYLAIRIGVAELPPALFAGVRFLIAGGILLGAARLLGRRLPTRRRDWTTNLVVGFLLLFCGNGLVVWAEQFTPSGVAAIFVVTVTLWLALFDAVIPGSVSRPTWRQVTGLLVGFGGTLLLVDEPGALRDADWRGPLALTVASAAWALGSVYSARRPTESGPEVNSALQMLTGGVVLTLVGSSLGEWHAVHLSARGLGALAYLVVFGTLVAFSAYIWLLGVSTPARVGTYAYVNPVVALVLGWAMAGEPLTFRSMVAAAIIVGSVVVITTGRTRPQR